MVVVQSKDKEEQYRIIYENAKGIKMDEERIIKKIKF
jgi:hypothetical protein